MSGQDSDESADHTNSRRNFLRAVGAGAAATGLAGVTSANPGRGKSRGRTNRDGSGTVTFLHDTHVHGHYGDADQAKNIERYFGLMDDLKAENPKLLRVGNGDDIASSVLSAAFEGKHIVDAFDAGGLDYDTYGNHDFDLGPEQLRAMVARSKFTWLSANVRDTRTGDVFAREQGAQQYAIHQVGGVTVGVTGLTTLETPNVSSPGENAEFLDLAEALHDVVPQMRADGADIVLVLSHVSSPVLEDVVADDHGVDVVVGDHVAQRYEEPKEINDTVISLVGDEYDYLGELTLDIEDGEVADFDFESHSLKEAEPDPARDVQKVANSYRNRLDDELNVVIGRSTVDLNALEADVRSQETNLGNFIADAVRTNVDADVGLMNGGGIRSDTLYPAGDITKKTVLNILPFQNTVTKLEISGETLLATLEHGATQYQDGGFPQVSGMQFTFDPSRPDGDRVVEATVGGDPVDTAATYTLATNNFVAGGGDNYTMLTDETVLVPAEQGALLSALIIDVIQRETPISPEVEGRITQADASSTTAALSSSVGAAGDD